MSPDLQALFTQNKPVVLGVVGAAVVGVALISRKKSAGSPTPAASPAGTIPAAGIVPSSSVQSAYPNTTASDVYNSLQPTLAQILNQQANQTGAGTSAPLTAPRPIASSLFAPSGSGNYVAYPQGTIAEVEKDGSQLGLTANEWQKLAAGGASYDMLQNNSALTQANTNGTYFEVQKNLASAKPAGGTAG